MTVTETLRSEVETQLHPHFPFLAALTANCELLRLASRSCFDVIIFENNGYRSMHILSSLHSIR